MTMIRNAINCIPWTFLLPLTLLLALAPFKPQPHLVEKLQMLADGLLVRPVDIFDLFLHGSPLLLVLGKFLGRQKQPPTI